MATADADIAIRYGDGAQPGQTPARDARAVERERTRQAREERAALRERERLAEQDRWRAKWSEARAAQADCERALWQAMSRAALPQIDELQRGFAELEQTHAADAYERATQAVRGCAWNLERTGVTDLPPEWHGGEAEPRTYTRSPDAPKCGSSGCREWRGMTDGLCHVHSRARAAELADAAA